MQHEFLHTVNAARSYLVYQASPGTVMARLPIKTSK